MGLLERLVAAKLKAREFQVVHRLTGAHLEPLWHRYQGVWWSRGRNLNDVRRAVEHSDLIVAYCDPATGRLAGFARVLTDFVYKAVIFDVIVDRPHRRLGLGRMLLEAVTSQPALLFVEHIELYCRPELVPFYEQWGFTADLDELCFMRKKHQPLIHTAKQQRRLAS